MPARMNEGRGSTLRLADGVLELFGSGVYLMDTE
jgi:hypothetical protein